MSEITGKKYDPHYLIIRILKTMCINSTEKLIKRNKDPKYVVICVWYLRISNLLVEIC